MNAEATTVDDSLHSAERQRLLVVLAALLEALYDRKAVQVLSTLKPTDMRSGGARIPGTSYELPPRTAASAMQQLVEMRGCLAAGPLLAAADGQSLSVMRASAGAAWQRIDAHRVAPVVPDLRAAVHADAHAPARRAAVQLGPDAA